MSNIIDFWRNRWPLYIEIWWWQIGGAQIFGSGVHAITKNYSQLDKANRNWTKSGFVLPELKILLFTTTSCMALYERCMWQALREGPIRRRFCSFMDTWTFFNGIPTAFNGLEGEVQLPTRPGSWAFLPTWGEISLVRNMSFLIAWNASGKGFFP
jgi:hypothetical protein